MRALIVLGLVAASAQADELPTIESVFAPAIRIGGGYGVTVREVRLDVRGAPEVSWLRIEVSSRFGRMVTLPIDLPRGTRMLGVGFGEGTETTWAHVESKPVADERVERGEVEGVIEPLAMTGDEEHLVIRTMPSATIELALALPRIDRLAVDPSGIQKLAVTIDGKVVRVTGRAPIDVSALALQGSRAAQDAFVVDGTEPRGPMIDGAPPAIACSFGHPEVRRRVRWHQARLRRCFTLAAQRDPTLAGTATLHFRIRPDGTVGSATADGDLPPSVTDCLAEVVRGIDFPQSDETVEVNYPLTFRPLGG